MEKRLQIIKQRADSLREEQKSLREDNLNFKQQAKITNKAHKEQEVFFPPALFVAHSVKCESIFF